MRPFVEIDGDMLMWTVLHGRWSRYRRSSSVARGRPSSNCPTPNSTPSCTGGIRVIRLPYDRELRFSSPPPTYTDWLSFYDGQIHYSEEKNLQRTFGRMKVESEPLSFHVEFESSVNEGVQTGISASKQEQGFLQARIHGSSTFVVHEVPEVAR